jgi:hypothetical protein
MKDERLFGQMWRHRKRICRQWCSHSTQWRRSVIDPPSESKSVALSEHTIDRMKYPTPKRRENGADRLWAFFALFFQVRIFMKKIA